MSAFANHTLPLNFGESEPERAEALMRRMGDFIALFEAAEEKFQVRQRNLEEYFSRIEQAVDEQQTKIVETLQAFQDVMTEAGAARWRVAAEQALREGKQHLKSVENVTNDFQALSLESYERLDKAVSYTIKSISEAVNSVNFADFRQLIDESCIHVEDTATAAIRQIKTVINWFQWKNILLVLCVTLVTSIITCLYIDDEWPWEAHKQVNYERHAGETLLKAWPKLSAAEKTDVITQSQALG